MTDFVSLHNVTDCSLLNSIISIKDLFLRAKELGQSAVGITDNGSLGAAWEALKYSKQTGVKLIIGCECYFKDEIQSEEKFRYIVLLAKNHLGYRNLLTLNKEGFDQGISSGKKTYSVIDWKILEKYAEGLICLTACGNGIVSQLLTNGKFEEAEKTLLKLKSIFGENLGIEVQPNNMERGANFYSEKIDQRFLNRRLIELGKKHKIRIVPTCNAHYLKKEDSDVHDVFLAIGSHQPIYSNFRLKYPVSDFYLKSGEEVKNFFSRNFGEEFANNICANTIYFSSLCETPDWIDPKFSNPTGKELPVFPVKNEKDYPIFLDWIKTQSQEVQKLEEDSLYLRYKSFNSLATFFVKKNVPEEQKKEYLDRVEEELDTLNYCGVSSYMLIVADYINWCKKNDILVGDGRGSSGGCFVGYLLNIHNANSIKYGLMFPRFHNKLKQSYSDIDSDFSKQNRFKVIEYIKNKYGENYFSQISNINTITPKVYIRDICRSLELGGSKEAAVALGNNVADCISSDISSIEEAVEKSPIFQEYCKKYPEFIKYKSICKKPRAAGVHASGYILCKRPINEIVPVRKDKDNFLTIEYDKDTAEENGLVKMDILGLSTLDIIESTYNLIKSSGKEIPEIDYEIFDKKTYDLISSGNTFGVFQFGVSGGTIDLCKKIKPKSIEDLALITALARPQAREIREAFIKTRNSTGNNEVKLLHPSLKRAFKNTYGYPLYDESLLLLAKDVAGWDLDDADKLRKLTKEKGKNPEKAKKWKKEFIEGAISNNLSEEIAEKIWTQIVEPFGRYAFNLSHSILYSITSFKTAYLKAHYPVEFLLANLMSEIGSNTPDAKANIDKYKSELREHKIKILPPNINTSKLSYTIMQDQLLTGLDALKFVGEDAIKDIIEKRPFKDFFDFMVRVDSRKVRANTIQALAAAGSMDSFGLSRKLIYLYCSDYRKKLQIWLKKHNPITEQFIYPWIDEKEWNIQELYALEQYYLGESFICAPTQAYGSFFKDNHRCFADLKKLKNRTKIFPIKGIVVNFFEFKVKKETSKFYGQPMIKAIIEDKNGDQCSCTIFPDRWQLISKRIKELQNKAVFEPGLALSFAGTTNIYEDEVGIILEDLFAIALAPKVPIDLKAKKVSLKKEKSSDLIQQNNKNINNLQLLSEVEDNLYNLGLIDLDLESSDD